jgi:hypothetical protein
MNLKPFNLEKALAGDPVVTREGQQVTEIFLCKTANKTESSVVFVCNGKVYATTVNGNFDGFASSHDLFMAPKIVKKSGWLNVYPNNTVGYTVHPTKESADINKCDISNRVACIFVEWEEEEE